MAVSYWKKSVENVIAVDLGHKDVYGANGFELYYKYQDETSPSKADVEFSEIIEPISDAVSVKTTADVEKGATEIPVDDTSKIKVGMRFDDGNGQIFYVDKVLDSSIVIRRPLKKAIAKDTTLNQVGNTGVYEAKFTPEKNGALIFVIANPVIGLQNISTKVMVVENLNDDIVATLTSAKNEIENKLDDIRAVLGVHDNIVIGKVLA